MIRALIIDDEEDARVILRSYLSMYCEMVEVVGEADGVKTGLNAIQTLKPDLVFLDVRLSPGSSFDILQQLEELNFDIIFTTAYDEYAVRAIRFSAIDYLLKPVDVDELVKAVGKAGEKKREEGRKIRYDIFKENLGILNEQFGRIVLPTMDGFVVVEVKNIVRCEADRNYTQFFFVDGKKTTIPRTMKVYEELLSNLGFFRAHQSHLINLQQVTAYKRRKKGGIAILQDHTEVPVSENRKDEFIERFNPI
ncbi:MAG: LytTR family DNA-binding domain-containing protein [Bacteroidia bacterium]